ncbi:hypothetical protein PPERSA_09913 [Pseudocohnilembus persalinus]|uniref:Chromatin modification-related protein EAF6 n=1 Tax=Pseudocohnilembus persalinus TaxID=266149 RepID=A0A0V0QJK1_PSEPJ|nr:hypothetical protein PPERSA_09913 [Pseudocohnilembus persalinus]|eukprot:KRX02296.1 hypothetical protein PPERSA_09913 [Pseudocohnilembus persalinus]
MTQQFIEMIDKKTLLEQELQTLEQQIYDLETHYLEGTQNTGKYLNVLNLGDQLNYIKKGNIIKGWEGYFTLKSNKQQNMPLKKPKISDNERIFSLSSMTSPAQRNNEENYERNIHNANGLSQQIKSKKNKKRKNYDSKRQTDSPSRNQDLESSLVDDLLSENRDEDSIIDNKPQSPIKKKKIKKEKTKTKQGKLQKYN